MGGTLTMRFGHYLANAGVIAKMLVVTFIIAACQPAAPQATAAPRTVSSSQIQHLEPPRPVYPTQFRLAKEQGRVVVQVLVDTTGRPVQVSLQGSSGYPALDESALTAVRSARFRPFMEGGAAQPVWVLIPINFVLQ